ncbi:MAG: hypothetical protein FWC91_10175 [Defluviitaleaceae bacterium]|nr:hypothetical protein [Defluviitaleaceae bacterium]
MTSGDVNKRTKYSAPVLQTYPNLEDDHRESKTGAPVPTDSNVVAAKHWVEENEL